MPNKYVVFCRLAPSDLGGAARASATQVKRKAQKDKRNTITIEGGVTGEIVIN